jgi:hypothetical protein
VPEVLVMASPDPDVWINTTETISRKVKALLCHVSQLPDPDSLEERIVGWGRMNAAAGHMPEGQTAESFKVVSTA